MQLEILCLFVQTSSLLGIVSPYIFANSNIGLLFRAKTRYVAGDTGSSAKPEVTVTLLPVTMPPRYLRASRLAHVDRDGEHVEQTRLTARQSTPHLESQRMPFLNRRPYH